MYLKEGLQTEHVALHQNSFILQIGNWAIRNHKKCHKKKTENNMVKLQTHKDKKSTLKHGT